MSTIQPPVLASAVELLACSDCDLLHRPVALIEGAVARCRRCGARLQVRRRRARQHALAYLSASLVLFLLANLFPFLSLSIAGNVRENRLISGVLELHREGFWILAAVVLTTCIVAPLVKIAGLFLALAPRSRSNSGSIRLRRLLEHAQRWAMLDVFLLGALVALVKLSDLADIGLERGFFAYVALMVVSILASISAEPLWLGAEDRH